GRADAAWHGPALGRFSRGCLPMVGGEPRHVVHRPALLAGSTSEVYAGGYQPDLSSPLARGVMVAQLFLVQSVGVRIPAGQLSIRPKRRRNGTPHYEIIRRTHPGRG